VGDAFTKDRQPDHSALMAENIHTLEPIPDLV